MTFRHGLCWRRLDSSPPLVTGICQTTDVRSARLHRLDADRVDHHGGGPYFFRIIVKKITTMAGRPTKAVRMKGNH
jgi:hypothetical protein